MERERIIEALKICDSAYDGVVCKKCPIKNKDYNGSWYDKDGDCYQHLMREAAELLSEQSAIQPVATDTNVGDTISRQAAIDAAALSAAEWDGMYVQDINGRIREALEKLPSAQLEEAIPVSWIEARIKRFMTMDNAFGGLTANIMLVMLNEWKREQEGETT